LIYGLALVTERSNENEEASQLKKAPEALHEQILRREPMS
jgi:hypothetical protein